MAAKRHWQCQRSLGPCRPVRRKVTPGKKKVFNNFREIFRKLAAAKLFSIFCSGGEGDRHIRTLGAVAYFPLLRCGFS